MVNLKRTILLNMRLSVSRNRIFALLVLISLTMIGRLAYYTTGRLFIRSLLTDVIWQESVRLLDIIFCIFPYILYLLMIDLDGEGNRELIAQRLPHYSSRLLSVFLAQLLLTLCFWLLYAVLGLIWFRIVFIGESINLMSTIAMACLSLVVHCVSTLILVFDYELARTVGIAKSTSLTVLLCLMGLFVVFSALNPDLANLISPVQFMILTPGDLIVHSSRYLGLGLIKVLILLGTILTIFRIHGGEMI
ncbi:hypothetical protein [Lapidilactobacillus bayanensis]|uniref:hypothetical protein n=1 Tax=Lapidilactobacillus bayanensis TaxID=2485998 RepID=UPI000F77B9D1|nr:hypothetical protein [Lapidilactobacillus bayanensis]